MARYATPFARSGGLIKISGSHELLGQSVGHPSEVISLPNEYVDYVGRDLTKGSVFWVPHKTASMNFIAFLVIINVELYAHALSKMRGRKD